jgi:hypothetical protein
MITWDDRSLIEDMLARGVDDWVTAAEVLGIADRRGLADDRDILDLALGLIVDVLTRRLMVAGDINDGRHVPWDCSTAEAIGRIAKDWCEREDPNVFPGEIAWLDVTPEGGAVGQAVLDREQEFRAANAAAFEAERAAAREAGSDRTEA